VPDLLVDLATYLDTQTAWTLATDLFIGYLPESPDGATVLHEYPGNPPLETMGVDAQPAVIRPRVQIEARDATYPLARARSRLAYQRLVLLTNTTVNGAYYERVDPLQEPFALRNDESDRWVFVFNVDVWRDAE
jgi:hypothetical protein